MAGILAGVILFAAIFTTGFSLILFVNSSTQSTAQANIQRQNLELQSSGEKLLVTVNQESGCSQCLWVRATNTGGVPSTIIDVYATSNSGDLISNSVVSPPSHFLKVSLPAGLGDLNISLPYTLGVGASTKSQGDIGIEMSALKYTPGEYLVVSLLTSSGNVFSAQYPPPPLTNTTYVNVNKVNSTVMLEQIAGGPQLSVTMTASALCPDGSSGCTQTFTCNNGCVSVKATVYNLASATASGVSVTLGTPSVGGTASVTPYPGPLAVCTFPGGSTTANIPAGLTATATCQFSANTGATGGLASFSGTASGDIGFPVTSAEALSNSIEIGGLASVTTQGAFVANFFFLKYSSCYQNTGGNFNPASGCTLNASPLTISNLPSAGSIAAGSNFFVAFYVQVTNLLNAPLPILQYSYTYGDSSISGETFFFLAGTNSTMANGVYYPSYSGTPSLVAYPSNCGTSPTPSNCILVKPGQTVDLTFAACGYGSNNWAWGSQQDAKKFDNSAGCTGSPPDILVPEAMPLGVVLSYVFNGQVYSQLMPFQGQQYIRSSSTLVSCAPQAVTAGTATTCTASVRDTDGVPKSAPPGGTVTFSGQAVGLGTFSSNSCTISFGSCAVTYTPYISSQGSISVKASYTGDSAHEASSNTTTITALDPTTTSITGPCVGATVPDGTQTTCTVTVKDNTGGVPSTPMGTVTMTDNPSGYGTFGTCNLSPAGLGTASCTVSYKPLAGNAGAITITAAYSGDSNHGPSSGTTGLFAKATPTITTTVSSSGTIVIGSSATDTATLSGAYNPTGSVTFTVYSDSGCTAQVFTSAKSISGSSATSGSFTAASVGTYYWKASYPGDSNNVGYTTTCGSSGETLTVAKASPTITTTVSSSGTIVIGSSATDSGTFSGGYSTLKGTLVFNAFTSSTCSGSASFTSSTITVNGNGPYTSNSFTPPSIGTYYWRATFTDTDGSNNGFIAACGGSGETLTVVVALSVGTPTATPSTVDLGQTSSSLSDTFSGGIGPYTCQWLQEAPGAGTYSNLGGSSSCTSPASRSTGTLSTTGTWHFELKVTDNTGATVTSNSVAVTVNNALVAPVISVSPVTVLARNPATLSTTTSFSGGTSTYTCQWLQEAPGAGTYSNLGSSFTAGCTTSAKPTTSTGTLSAEGTWHFELQVTDSAGAVVTSAPVTVSVTQHTTSTTLTCTPQSMSGSGTATCTVTVTDTSTGPSIIPTGSVTLTLVSWSGNPGHPPSIPSSCTLNAAGSCTFTLTGGGRSGTAVLRADYNGDADHTTSTTSPSNNWTETLT